MKKYRSPEMIIRDMMGGGSLNEQHAPALKVPEPYRVEVALQVLHDNGITTATRKDEKTLAVGNKELDMAMQVLDNALMHGKIEAKPLVVSAEAIDVPVAHAEPVDVKAEPTPPEGGHKLGEGVNDEEELATGNIDLKTGTFQSAGRTLHNRKENQLKKIDEEEQIDELSKKTVGSYVKAASHDMASHSVDVSQQHKLANKADKAGDDIKADYHDHLADKSSKRVDKRIAGIKTAVKKLTKEEAEQIDELSFGKMAKYTEKSRRSVNSLAQARKLSADHGSKTNKLDHKIAARKAGIKTADTKKAVHMKKIFAESTIVERVLGLISELSKNKLTKYVDKAGDQKRDAHMSGDRKTYFKRHTGIAKAAAKVNEEQIDELSRGKLKAYARKARVDVSKNKVPVTNHDHAAFVAKVNGDKAGEAHHTAQADKHLGHIAKRTSGIDKAKMKLREHIELNEGKKDDEAAVEKAGKHFASHARADNMHGDMMKAAKHYNYVQDATDHVYSNNAKHVKYADWHAMKPHIEDHFRKHGLED
jgi:hypothetical protein